MTKMEMTGEFHADVGRVWSVVTSLESWDWRSDISKIEVLEPGRKFIEYTKDGFKTTFTITAFVPNKCYQFSMENENMQGEWSGLFYFSQGKTQIQFTEQVTAKKLMMKPFVKAYLKKQQALYLEDLKKALGE